MNLKQLKMENPDYDGSNYIRDLDRVRLAGQMKSIFLVMRDSEWRTLNEIAMITGFGEASISAQLRNLRKEKFGSHIVDKRRRGDKEKGLWEYGLGVNDIPVQGELNFNNSNHSN